MIRREGQGVTHRTAPVRSLNLQSHRLAQPTRATIYAYHSVVGTCAVRSRRSRAPMPLAAGHRLGPYEIVAALGAGGMGEVYRARDTRLDRTVAIQDLPAP